MRVDAPRGHELRKLLLFAVEDPGDATSDASASALDCLLGIWEWIEQVAASSAAVALAVARRVERPILIVPELESSDLVHDPELRVRRALAGVARLETTGADAVLVVVERSVFAALWLGLVGAPPPPGRPRAGDAGLLVRDADGRWRPGRKSSDPPALRSTLERVGLADPCRLAQEPLRHVAPLQLRAARHAALPPHWS
jgi:hypothetical protein